MLAASIPATAAQLSGRSVKIGVMYPLTGKGAEWGEAAKVGINLAAEEINAAVAWTFRISLASSTPCVRPAFPSTCRRT